MSRHDLSVVVVLSAILAEMSNLFAYCFFGRIATESFVLMAECLYECNWINLTPKLQRYFVIMIGNAQRPIYYRYYNNTIYLIYYI